MDSWIGPFIQKLHQRGIVDDAEINRLVEEKRAALLANTLAKLKILQESGVDISGYTVTFPTPVGSLATGGDRTVADCSTLSKRESLSNTVESSNTENLAEDSSSNSESVNDSSSQGGNDGESMPTCSRNVADEKDFSSVNLKGTIVEEAPKLGCSKIIECTKDCLGTMTCECKCPTVSEGECMCPCTNCTLPTPDTSIEDDDVRYSLPENVTVKAKVSVSLGGTSARYLSTTSSEYQDDDLLELEDDDVIPDFTSRDRNYAV